jgi:hypothetical protein
MDFLASVVDSHLIYVYRGIIWVAGHFDDLKFILKAWIYGINRLLYLWDVFFAVLPFSKSKGCLFLCI